MQFPDGEMGHGMKYSASKILAHQATGAFLKSRTLNFDLITFHPTFVLGPSLVQTSAQEISGINAWLWNSLQSEKPLFPALCVHVQDVAEAHIRALSMPLSSGTALLLSGRPFTWTDVVGYVKDNFKEIDVKLKPPFEDQPWVDTSQADNTLAIKWRSMEDIVGSVLKQQLDFQKTGL
jgi:nucleoside-diphosphate-sugar epimerase